MQARGWCAGLVRGSRFPRAQPQPGFAATTCLLLAKLLFLSLLPCAFQASCTPAWRSHSKPPRQSVSNMRSAVARRVWRDGKRQGNMSRATALLRTCHAPSPHQKPKKQGRARLPSSQLSHPAAYRCTLVGTSMPRPPQPTPPQK